MRSFAIGGSSALAAVAALLVAGCGGSGRPGTDLAFISTRDGDYAIFGMNADGGQQRRLTHQRGDPSTRTGLFFQTEPEWSPDGTKIAFASRRNGPFQIFVMQAGGSGTRRLTSTKADDQNPTWSPDGSEIAFDRGSPGDIYVMSADGTHPRRLGNDFADESDPAWSPNGRWIAFTRRTPGTTVRELWLVRPDGSGSGRRQLTHRSALSQSPAWSPDGKRIAFSSETTSGNGDIEIYTVGLSGRDPRGLTSSAITGAYEPSWSPDGRRIAFSRNGSIYTVATNGKEDRLTDPKGNDSSPAWRPVQAQ
jgi:Tol biopolymer transport system component